MGEQCEGMCGNRASWHSSLCRPNGVTQLPPLVCLHHDTSYPALYVQLMFISHKLLHTPQIFKLRFNSHIHLSVTQNQQEN